MSAHVFHYQLTDRPDWLVMIDPEAQGEEEARKVLEHRFGADRVLAVVDGSTSQSGSTPPLVNP